MRLLSTSLASFAVLMSSCQEQDSKRPSPSSMGPSTTIVPKPSALPERDPKQEGGLDGFRGGPPAKSQDVVATCAAISQDNKFMLVAFGGGSYKKLPKRTQLADSLVLGEGVKGEGVKGTL